MTLNLHVELFPKIWRKRKINLLFNYEHENKNTFFSNNKTKFNLKPKT